MRSSAHSHESRYLASMLRNAVWSWLCVGAFFVVGFVLARERDDGFGKWMKVGDTGRD